MKLITKFPQVLGFSVEHSSAPKLKYLAEEVGLGRAGAVKVITRCPQVLSFNVDDNIAPKVKCLAEEAGAGREGTTDIILAYPSLFRFSIERKLRPTLHFLVEQLPDTNAAKMIRLAMYNLAGSLVPRVRLLATHGQAGRYAASNIAAMTPAEFCEKVGITMEEYDAEVAACVREHAEKHPSPEAGGGDVGRGVGSGEIGG